jgi:glyoxylase-like metal-dependent hydrolase (beta-lactamase superfamily II)
MITIKTFTDNMFGENAYVVARNVPGICWVIDPGLPDGTTALLEYLRADQLTVVAIVNTHAHADHIAGIDAVKERFPDAELYLAHEEKAALTDPDENLSSGLGTAFQVNAEVDHDLPHGSTLSLEDTSWQILDTSGHSPGGRSFYCEQAGVVFSGDALFEGSIGRTDFHHSNHHNLISNIKNHLLTLPEDTLVYSGHGGTTTIGRERKWNPFLTDSA